MNYDAAGGQGRDQGRHCTVGLADGERFDQLKSDAPVSSRSGSSEKITSARKAMGGFHGDRDGHPVMSELCVHG
jgi:hypothetical protein